MELFVIVVLLLAHGKYRVGGEEVEFIREIWWSGVRVWWEGGVEVGSVFGPLFLVKGRSGVKICLVWEMKQAVCY